MSRRFSASPRTPPPPLDAAALHALALSYVGRYATTRAKLAAYLRRKLRERGWGDADDAGVADLVARMAALGYVDDAAFAEARGAALTRRGFGARRVAESLYAAGIAPEDAAAARDAAAADAFAAALRFARRRRIGPFAQEPDEQRRRLGLAAMLRAGHSYDLARRIALALPGTELAEN